MYTSTKVYTGPRNICCRFVSILDTYRFLFINKKLNFPEIVKLNAILMDQNWFTCFSIKENREGTVYSIQLTFGRFKIHVSYDRITVLVCWLHCYYVKSERCHYFSISLHFSPVCFANGRRSVLSIFLLCLWFAVNHRGSLPSGCIVNWISKSQELFSDCLNFE